VRGGGGRKEGKRERREKSGCEEGGPTKFGGKIDASNTETQKSKRRPTLMECCSLCMRIS